MNTFISKITSRKFIIAVAAFLASLGTEISGISTGNQKLATVGLICTVFSAAIYAASEAYVDAASVRSSTNATVTTNTTVVKSDASNGTTTQE